ncbi:MBL fold metallo-hydrolase [Streptomyces chartreusis]|uniref:MBL fold metallo-hydrolase n=1 Tax=Streptomyces chartreusis TaxID=1969 RepID=UPI0033D02D12
MTPLTYSTLVQDGIQRAGEQRMPSGDPLVSSPLTSTLIVGDATAVLVDPPLTREQTRKVGDWIEHSGKQLSHIYITHGHGDHWFGTGELLRRFPTAQAWASPDAIAMMHYQATTGRALRWDKDFPGLIGDTPVVARPVPEEGLLLEGHVLKPVPTHHTDTDHTSVLHIPDLGLVVAGDAVYNNVHLCVRSRWSRDTRTAAGPTHRTPSRRPVPTSTTSSTSWPGIRLRRPSTRRCSFAIRTDSTRRRCGTARRPFSAEPGRGLKTASSRLRLAASRAR